MGNREPLDLHDRMPAGLLRVLREESVLSQSYLVGGFVRDSILGRSSKDLDVEVFGVSYETLAKRLARWGRVDVVGKSFGVIKLTLSDAGAVDFSVPRRDSKAGPGHRGFHVTTDPEMPLEEAIRRRDFTINALLYDPRERIVLDFADGLRDLDLGRLRVVDAERFVDDPLRVLRAMQFVARFDLTADDALVSLARSMRSTLPELAAERVGEEWRKWASKSVRPSRGLEFLRQTDWLSGFPELAAVVGVPQDPEWHPEGDVWVHTGHCCDAMAQLPAYRESDEADRVVLMLATLLHDVGKAITTSEELRQGRLRIVSPGHETAGLDPAKAFLDRLQLAQSVTDRVVPLVANHMVHLKSPSDRAIRRLAHRLQPERIANLCVLMTADSFGRPPLAQKVPQTVRELQERSQALQLAAQAPTPLLLGRDLLAVGYSPGKTMGVILQAAFEAQLDGVFESKEGALKWIQVHHPLEAAQA